MRSGDSSSTLRKRCFDARPLNRSLSDRDRPNELWLVRKPTLIHGELIRFADNERTFDYVLKFANVAGPRILLQRFETLFLDTLDLFSRSLRITTDKIIYEQRNILFAIAQSR